MLTSTCKYNTEIREQLSTLIIINKLYGIHVILRVVTQCKAFSDATNSLWETQALAGKPAGIFWSTAFHGGGQERTT
ncbi:putative NAD(P)H dehydrogenase (quinone) [Helianthus anomalus]